LADHTLHKMPRLTSIKWASPQEIVIPSTCSTARGIPPRARFKSPPPCNSTALVLLSIGVVCVVGTDSRAAHLRTLTSAMMAICVQMTRVVSPKLALANTSATAQTATLALHALLIVATTKLGVNTLRWTAMITTYAPMIYATMSQVAITQISRATEICATHPLATRLLDASPPPSTAAPARSAPCTPATHPPVAKLPM